MKKNLAERSTLGTILILAPLIFTFALALDIYLPSIPDIKNYFHVNQATMQLTVSIFILITGFMQLLFGPISDQIGRRKVVLGSTVLLIFGSLVCAAAGNITFLIIGRAIQALGACGMMVSCFAIVRDVFSAQECARVYSFLNSTISLSPLLAPVIGGYIAYYINWQASFVFLSLVGVIIFISVKINIQETLHPDNKRTLSKQSFYNYFTLLKSQRFLVYTFSASAAFAGFSTFFSSSSYIVINLLHVPTQHFGFYFAFIAVIFFIGSLMSGYFTKHLGTYKTIVIGAFLMALSGVVMLLWYHFFGLSMAGFVVPMMLTGIGGAFMMGAGAGGAISPFPQMAGTASALFGCMQFVFAFLVSQIVMAWPVESTEPLGIALGILGGVALITSAVSYKKVRDGVKA